MRHITFTEYHSSAPLINRLRFFCRVVWSPLSPAPPGAQLFQGHLKNQTPKVSWQIFFSKIPCEINENALWDKKKCKPRHPGYITKNSLWDKKNSLRDKKKFPVRSKNSRRDQKIPCEIKNAPQISTCRLLGYHPFSYPAIYTPVVLLICWCSAWGSCGWSRDGSCCLKPIRL